MLDRVDAIGAVGPEIIRHQFQHPGLQIDVPAVRGIGPAAQVQSVAIGTARDIVAKVAAADHKPVIARPAKAVILETTAVQHIIAVAAEQAVDAIAAAQQVTIGAAIEEIGIAAAIQAIGPAHPVQLIAGRTAKNLVAAIAANRMFDIGETDPNPVDGPRHPIQPDDRAGADGSGIHRVCPEVTVIHRRRMAADPGIIGIFIGEDIAVIGAEIAKGADHDIGHRQHIAAKSVDHPHCPLACGAFAAERLGFKGPGAVEIIAAAGIGDQAADRAAGRGQIHLHIAGEGGGKRHLDRDPFDSVIENSGAAE